VLGKEEIGGGSFVEKTHLIIDSSCFFKSIGANRSQKGEKKKGKKKNQEEDPVTL